MKNIDDVLNQAAAKANPAIEPQLKEQNEITKDTWSITLPKTRIHTLPQLLEKFAVDETVWEVERFVANKWDMGYVVKDQNSASFGNASQHELYQVKAYLRRRRFTEMEHAVGDNARLRSQVEKLRLQVGSERSIAKRLAQRHVGFDDFITGAQEVRSALADFQLPTSAIARPKQVPISVVREGHNEDAVLLISDTHFGAVHRREDTSGFPEFDLVISANRFGYVIRKAKQVLTMHRAMYPIKKLYVWIGGDIGNGVLHDSPYTNALFLPAQVDFSFLMLKLGIEDLLELTKPDENGVVVIEQIVLLFTAGNHMRLDEKMPYSYQAQRTLDWLIYRQLIHHFQGNPKVTVKEEMSPYITENIRGHRYLFAHGFQVGYKNSPDAQIKSMTRFMALIRALFDSPEYRKKVGLEGATFDRICIGDIHVPVSFPRLKSNGSLPGQNELGVNWTLEPIPAGQQIFGVSDKHLETFQYYLDCSQVQRTQEDMNEFGIFAAEYSKLFGRNG